MDIATFQSQDILQQFRTLLQAYFNNPTTNYKMYIGGARIDSRWQDGNWLLLHAWQFYTQMVTGCCYLIMCEVCV